MATQTTATLPTLQQTQIHSLLVQPLEAASVFLASGPKIIDTHGPIRIPRIATGLTVGAVAEGGTIPESSVGMDEVTMLPSTLKCSAAAATAHEVDGGPPRRLCRCPSELPSTAFRSE